MPVNRPEWGKQALKTLIDMGLTVTELAGQLGMTRQHISSVINGRTISPNTKDAICRHLKISA